MTSSPTVAPGLTRSRSASRLGSPSTDRKRAPVAAWSRTTGHAIVASSVDAGVYRFVLRRK